MNFVRNLTCLALVAFLCSPAIAQETSAEAEKSCAECPSEGQCPHSSTLTSADQEEGTCAGCPIMTAAMEKLPKMTFKVGDEETCCSESAAATSSSTGCYWSTLRPESDEGRRAAK